MAALAFILLMMAGCGEKVVDRTTTVTNTKTRTVTPPGVITLNQCLNMDVGKGTTLRKVLDTYGWPHIQDFQDTSHPANFGFPLSENSKSVCLLTFKNNFDGGDSQPTSTDPDKVSLSSKTVQLK